MDTARLHMASKTPSYIPHGSLQHSSRRMPAESASLPQSSWLSDATEFATSPLSQSYLGVGASVPVDSFLSSSLSDIGAPSYSIHRARSQSRVPGPLRRAAFGTPIDLKDAVCLYELLRTYSARRAENGGLMTAPAEQVSQRALVPRFSPTKEVSRR